MLMERANDKRPNGILLVGKWEIKVDSMVEWMDEEKRRLRRRAEESFKIRGRTKEVEKYLGEGENIQVQKIK